MKSNRITQCIMAVVVFLSGNIAAALSQMATEFVSPVRIVWMSDSTSACIRHAERLLLPYSGQVSVADGNYATLKSVDGHTASILLDFGKELQGGVEIAAAIRPVNAPVKLRIRYGESVTEAMSQVGDTLLNATNDHAMRDFTVMSPWLGTVNTSNSGFRFVRIDLIDKNVEYNLRAVRAIAQYRDIPYLGAFECSDERLNRIWRTGVYTVHLNMQEYLWDGIKRDRLVWIGDMHPEVMTVNTVFGNQDVVRKSLDFARNDTPLPGWMNGMCSYSLWWIIIQDDLYRYQGDKVYLTAQHGYLKGLTDQLIRYIGKDGKEELKDGTRFLDWPTSEIPDVIHAGLQSLMVLAMQSAQSIFTTLQDEPYAGKCAEALRRLRKVKVDTRNNKQAAALALLAGLSRNRQKDCEILLKGGADGFSTFYGYYMLEALAACGKYDEALGIISDYWGAMLDLGATTFWEELKYSDIRNAAPITEIVPPGKYDIHAGGGAYCYKGLRLSLCHGWASGPTSWMSRHVLGINPLDAGCTKVAVTPHLGQLTYAKGSFPTPHGVIRVSHRRGADGKVISEIDAPEGITIVKE